MNSLTVVDAINLFASEAARRYFADTFEYTPLEREEYGELFDNYIRMRYGIELSPKRYNDDFSAKTSLVCYANDWEKAYDILYKKYGDVVAYCKVINTRTDQIIKEFQRKTGIKPKSPRIEGVWE